MIKIWLLLLLALVLSVAGCETRDQTPPSDREFIPGQGWVPINH